VPRFLDAKTNASLADGLFAALGWAREPPPVPLRVQGARSTAGRAKGLRCGGWRRRCARPPPRATHRHPHIRRQRDSWSGSIGPRYRLFANCVGRSTSHHQSSLFPTRATDLPRIHPQIFRPTKREAKPPLVSATTATHRPKKAITTSTASPASTNPGIFAGDG